MSKTVILTGIAGFMGSHVMERILDTTDWNIIGIASFTHKGISERITDNKSYQANRERVGIVTHDLTAPFSRVFIDRLPKIDYIINVASESHVSRSIDHPVGFIKNNVHLMLNMLELARVVKPEKFIHISTDEVYGAYVDHAHKEWDVHRPSSPYAASKASQESIAYAYWRTYGVPVVITNTMNLYGQYQDREKYIPLVIDKISNGQTLSVHADSDNNPGVRTWIHARDQADALIWIADNVDVNHYPTHAEPSKYHIRGDTEMDNLSVAKLVAKIMGAELKYELVNADTSRPGHDYRYCMDNAKLTNAGWTPKIPLEDGLRETVGWYTK